MRGRRAGAPALRRGTGAAAALLLKVLVFTALVPGTVVHWLPVALLGRRPPVGDPWLRALGLAAMAAGAALYAWCAWDFAVAGRGTPAPIDPPRELVARGPYRYVRNPMYLGVVAFVVGEAALLGSPAYLGYAAAVLGAFHLRVVAHEEPVLRRTFGESYRAYRRAVPRWLPRRPPRPPPPAGR